MKSVVSEEELLKAAAIFWLEQVPVVEITNDYCRTIVKAYRDGKTSKPSALKALMTRKKEIRDYVIKNRIAEAELK